MTKTSQHTPSPWEIVPTVHSDRVNIFATDPRHHQHVGTFVSGSRKDLPVFRANARLIAAAPELLKALEFVSMTFADIEASKRKGYYTECPKTVAAAIAKATGGAA